MRDPGGLVQNIDYSGDTGYLARLVQSRSLVIRKRGNLKMRHT